ncbi:MAG: putative succinate dehydrogenase/fumarate reductase related rane subunit [Anaerolineales bacterium]|nr:putative succinate dehydrogenase/fumarate reductase related rane subunit [Anaerolineales bacterium]
MVKFQNRLHVDSPTIPLAELALEKLQIVHLNEKDVKDMLMLFAAEESRQRMEQMEQIKMGSGRYGWLLQAVSGILLVVLVGLHWVAQHFLAAGGLRTYADVAAYLRQPVIFGLEAAFLIVVTTHALLGVRAILLDLGLGPRADHVLRWALALVGAATVGYGLDLTLAVIR